MIYYMGIFTGMMYKAGSQGMMADRGYVGHDGFVGPVVAFITWVAVVSVLFALARLLWKKGDKLK